MSFFNKFIDRAKHVNKEDRPTAAEPSKESNRTFFGIHTPHSSTSSNPTMDSQQQQQQQQQHQQQQHLHKVQEESPATATNLYASGYVTPRQSQDLHQNMDIDTPGKPFCPIHSNYLSLINMALIEQMNEPSQQQQQPQQVQPQQQQTGKREGRGRMFL
jgi:FtsZ-interacting cell division protein YlmF